MKYRLYPSKDTTIIEGRTYNSGKNEVAELWYGSAGIARTLIYFDITSWIDKIDSGLVPVDISDVDCTLFLTNCFPSFEEYYDENDRVASSVDVEIRELTTSWDEGNGHGIVSSGGEDGFANWFSGTSLSAWTLSGGDYSSIVFTTHLDNGNENISGDVSTQVSAWCGGTNNGIVVKFSDDFETLSTEPKSITKFYTKDTHTYFLPYVEFEWDGLIKDQRDEVEYNLTKRLYLTTQSHGVYKNVGDISGITINFAHPDLSGSPIEIAASAITNQYPGIYYAEIDFPSNPGTTGDTTFTDTWYVDFGGGGNYHGITKTGSLTAGTSTWGTNSDGTKVYDISIPHLKNEYGTDEQVFLDVDVYERYTDDRYTLKNLEYKISLMDGSDEFVMVDWEDVHYGPLGNMIILDTSWFLKDNRYKIDIRTSSYEDEEIYFDHNRMFWVR